MTEVLLLNHNFEVLSFIEEKRAIRMIFKEKVEILSNWEDAKIKFGKEYMNYPAVLKMKYYVNKRITPIVFSRNAVLKRDKLQCQYCCKIIGYSQATMDHIIPKSVGGKSSFLNCVAACVECNLKKANRTPEQANMKLISVPSIPNKIQYFPNTSNWHEDWDFYLRKD